MKVVILLMEDLALEIAEMKILAECMCKLTDVKVDWLIIGFPGISVVGSIVAKHIISELNMKTVGYVRSPLIPPVAVFFDGILSYPYRIAYSKDLKLAVFVGEAPTPYQAYYHIANAVLDWADNVGAKEVVVTDGLLSERGTGPLGFIPDPNVFLVAEPDMKEKIAKINEKLPMAPMGYIGSLCGAILNEAIIRPIDGWGLLVETIGKYPDPLAASKAIQTLNDLKSLDIDVSRLEAESNQIKEKLKDLMSKQMQIQAQEPTSTTSLPQTSGLYS
ncbi:MAG: proteasome assembly chaperone family protein [Promethearchaeota archaeon]